MKVSVLSTESFSLMEYLQREHQESLILTIGDNPVALVIPVKNIDLKVAPQIQAHFFTLLQKQIEQQQSVKYEDKPRYPNDSTPLYCSRGKCYLGYVKRGAGHTNRLYRPDGVIITGRATLPCECGAGREWYEDAKSLKQQLK